MSTEDHDQFLVVSEREHRLHARSLVRAAADHRPLQWCFAAEFEDRVQKGPRNRTLFIGDSKYAAFLRGLASNTRRKHGVAWATYKQHGFVWVEDVIIDLRATFPRLLTSLDTLRTEARYQADAAAYLDPGQPRPEGPLIASAYLEAAAEHPSLRLDKAPTNERDLKRSFTEAQFVLGLGQFLLDEWDSFVYGTRPG